MLPLAEMQCGMLGHLLAPAGASAARAIYKNWPISSADGLSVHRNTVQGGLRDALGLSFPTVRALVGEECFTAMVLAFVSSQPPRQACLNSYGQGLPAFIERYPATAELAYLPDVARFDWVLDERARYPGDDGRRPALIVPLDESLDLMLPSSLWIESYHYPVDEIRLAIEAGDDAALGAINLRSGPCWVAAWRGETRVSAVTIPETAARFLLSLLSGLDAEAALKSAAALASMESVLAQLQSHVFAASFAHLHQKETAALSGVTS